MNTNTDVIEGEIVAEETGAALAVVKPDGFPTEAIETFLAGRTENTQRAYTARLDRFTVWFATQPRDLPFVALLKGYIAYLGKPKPDGAGLSPRSIQAHVSTVKGLLKTAAALDTRLTKQLPQLDLAKPPAVRGEIQGDRLDRKQRDALLAAPDLTTHIGRRNLAILTLLACCGLRRSEVCNLNWEHISEIDGHKVIKNLSGKHGRVRTIKLDARYWQAITRWADLAGVDRSPDRPVFVAVRQNGTVMTGLNDDPNPKKRKRFGKPYRLTGNTIAYIVKRYCEKAGIPVIACHDLRRTAASLIRNGGASIEKVQRLLGHASPQTTSAYIGGSLDLDDNAIDYDVVKIPRIDVLV